MGQLRSEGGRGATGCAAGGATAAVTGMATEPRAADRARKIRLHLPMGEVREMWIPASQWRSGRMLVPVASLVRWQADGVSGPDVVVLTARPIRLRPDADDEPSEWIEDWLAEAE